MLQRIRRFFRDESLGITIPAGVVLGLTLETLLAQVVLGFEIGWQTNGSLTGAPRRLDIAPLGIRFNYGLIGLLVYILTLIGQIYHLRPLLRSADPRVKALAACAASCFVPYTLVMFTDNVLIYCQSFTVPMMMFVGASYATQRGIHRHRQSRHRFV